MNLPLVSWRSFCPPEVPSEEGPKAPSVARVTNVIAPNDCDSKMTCRRSTTGRAIMATRKTRRMSWRRIVGIARIKSWSTNRYPKMHWNSLHGCRPNQMDCPCSSSYKHAFGRATLWAKTPPIRTPRSGCAGSSHERIVQAERFLGHLLP